MKNKKITKSDSGGKLPPARGRVQMPPDAIFTESPALPAKRQPQAASPALDSNGRPPRTPGTGGRSA